MVNAASHGDPEAQRARAMCAQGYTVMQQKAQSPPKAWAVPLCPGAAAPPSSPVYSLADSYQPSQSLQAAMDVCHRGVFLVASITPAPAVTDGFFIWPPVNPCKLHCQPSNEYFAEKLWDAVVDGTLCYQGRVSWDLCINGICKDGLSSLPISPATFLPLLLAPKLLGCLDLGSEEDQKGRANPQCL
ncbi:hypothetical protein P7K49_037105 [Saguinus oedipus]|uniref:Uncharacterized protein n=1 Tax=Saguinus oedipus TaxID=9490 RepID=A0ABQ9TH49_SAGOE|nr:hypothetical protein P7K49_037105 [Saguinus oedipus]